MKHGKPNKTISTAKPKPLVIVSSLAVVIVRATVTTIMTMVMRITILRNPAADVSGVGGGGRRIFSPRDAQSAKERK